MNEFEWLSCGTMANSRKYIEKIVLTLIAILSSVSYLCDIL
jgi:hypothetical protein